MERNILGRKNPWAILLALSIAFLVIYEALGYSELPLLEKFQFRQTHTAISSYWIVQEGWQLDYQTPVAGYPWSIPIEFPIYQSIVAFIAWLGNFELGAVGRLVSVSFLLACAFPILSISKKIKLSSETAWVFCAFLWSSPIYFMYGKTFLMETTAVFFTLAGCPYAIDLFKSRPRWSSCLLCVIFFTMGALQKGTTTVPSILVFGLLILVMHFKNAGFRLPRMQKLICICLALLTPILVASLWTIYSDLVKSLNPLGQQLTSKALTAWNFGTLEQRLDTTLSQLIFWDRVFLNNAAGYFGLALIAATVLFAKKQLSTLVLICLIFFILPIEIFFNLHYQHDYYQASCTVFLIAALAIACNTWLPRLLKGYVIVPIVSVLIVVNNFYNFSNTYAKEVEAFERILFPQTLVIGDAVNRYSPEDSGIIVFGFNWSSEIAYYAKRKSFTVPEWFTDYNKVLLNTASYLGGKKLGAIVYCGKDSDLIKQQPEYNQNPRLLQVDKCLVWIPNLPLNALEKKILNIPQYSNSKFNNCGFYIDRVNGMSNRENKNIASVGLLSVNGWFGFSEAEQIAFDERFVTLTDSKNVTSYFKIRILPKINIKSYFKYYKMPTEIFTSTFDVLGLRGNYTLGLAQTYKGQLTHCTDNSIPIKFGE